MPKEGGEMMVNPFLWESKHEKARVELSTEKGRRKCSVPVGMDEVRGRSSTKGPMRGRGG
jgi:hypothetical protein